MLQLIIISIQAFAVYTTDLVLASLSRIYLSYRSKTEKQKLFITFWRSVYWLCESCCNYGMLIHLSIIYKWNTIIVKKSVIFHLQSKL